MRNLIRKAQGAEKTGLYLTDIGKKWRWTRLLSVLIILLTLGVGNAWGQISSQAPADGESYVVAVYSDSKYYALPNGAVNGSTISGVEIELNAYNKVSTTAAAGKTWTLEEGTDDNEGQYYFKYTSGGNTYYLYKNGTGKSNVNFKVSTGDKNYWSFATSGTGYIVTAVDRGSNHPNIYLDGTTFKCNTSTSVIRLLPIGDTGGGGGCSNQVNITNSSTTSVTHGSFDVDKTGSQDACSALSVTVTPNPDDHYHVASVSATDPATTGTAGDAVDNGDGTYTITYSANAKGNSTISVTFAEDTKYTVTWMKNGSQHTTTQVYSGEKPTFPSNPSSCDATSTTFYGWATSTWENTVDNLAGKTVYTSASAMPNVTATGTVYNAVFAKASSGGGGEPTEKFSVDVQAAVGDISLPSGYSLSQATEWKSSTHRQDGSNDPAYIKIYHTSTKLFSSLPAAITIKAELYGGTVRDMTSDGSSYYPYVFFTDNAGDEIAGSAKAICTSVTTSAAEKSVSMTVSDATNAYGIGIRHAKISGFNLRYSSITLEYAEDATTYSKYLTTCCTELGQIVLSNLSTSSTGTNVTVEVLTAGMNAYGDKDNVSGYEFKLYTASAGGSAAATYSSDSKAGTSHTFTGLTPLTQYWVTVRPIGSGSYCNTTAESDRVGVYTCPGSPNHVDVSGRWDRFGGETISLTAAAYATAGTGSAIPAAKITGYQWRKWYNSQWNNITGATSATYTKSNCDKDDSGSYQCVISTVAGCDIESDGFQVKVYVLECYTGGTTTYNFTRVGDTQAGTAQITLTAGDKEFKFHADNDYYGNDGTINEDVTNWVCSTSESDNLTIAAGLGGTFTINMEYSTGGNSSVEGEPEISVTYPRKTLYLTPGVWNVDGAKFAFYYFRDGGSSGWTDFITANDCGSSADIPQWNGVKVDAVRLKDVCSSPDWGDKWGAQTSDITVSSNNSITITGWNEGDYTYGTYAVPTYTISYAKGTVPTGGVSISGSKADESKTCGVDFTLPAAQFTTTGYVQTGWSKADGGAQYAAVSGTYTDNAAQTFYPVWTANTHSLTWDANGGDALTGDYTSGTVAYATAITAPNTPTWTGHTFGGWHNGSSVVTPATSMPDNDLTYTAQWSLATYTVTLNTNGGTINAGNVTSYTYGTGATLPTNVTKDGNRFDGWFDNNELDGDAVTSISSSATGNKEYWAKWTPVRTVTWSVNGSTWSSGVVEGNTHVISGEKVSALPTAPTKSDCDDAKVFVGWRATAIDGTSTSDPGGIFTTQAGSPTISANTTFYAVFADESGGDITLVTNVSELTNGTQVYIYSTFEASGNTYGAVAKAYDGSSNNVKATSGTVSNNKLTPGENACAYTVGVVTNGKTLYDGAYYLYAASTTSNHLKGTTDLSNVTAGWGDWVVSITNGAFSVSSYGNTSRGVMQFNKNGDTGDYTKAIFACYASADPEKYSAIQLFKKNPYVYSNYVTTCASCDADATYTNTTPTVSDIDCTGATLTMEDGLATVGADGCHVSDYGFVIGTSDNPAVGGDGVTKLQVGTSDPTIGADFSYDVTGLTKGTRYYIRAYATNLHGTAYSTSTNFWTKDVSSIAITTAPTKTNYLVGETFDATGMVVTATLASGATENVTSDVTYSTDPLTSGTNKDFAINYTLCETDKSVNQKINVYTLTVTEGTNPSYGTASGSANIVSITGLGEHKTYTVTVTSSNATAVDNGDNTWTITNPTGNVAVRVDYDDAAQVKVYYKVDGVTVTGLTQDVYQSETTTLPTASELATAMTAQSMDIPDDDYPNFYGWSETEFPAQTAEPTIVTGTPVISAEKIYYAVYTNLNKKRIVPSDFAGSYATNEGAKTIDGLGYNIHDICLQSSKIQFRNTPGYLYSTSALSYIKKIEITGLDLIVNACSDNAGTLDGDAITPSGSDTYVYTFPASKQYFKIKGKGGTDKVSLIEIFYADATVYYMTEFCATKITLTHNSPEHGTIEFGRSSLATCGSDKNVSLTITPDIGYQLTSWTVNTATSYADAKTTSPAVVTNSNNSAAQNITLTFAQDANKDYDVTATFGLMTVSSWAWTLNSAAIADPLNLYVGQSAKLDVAYTPAGVDASKKTYTRTKVDAYINWVGALNANYSTISGKASTGENTTAVTFTHADGPTTTVNVKVLPLPAVHFGDIVHNVAFDDVTASIVENALSATRTTPTHADFSGSYLNSCEEQHLHLVGWIREDWPALITYLEGGTQPTTSEITGAGNDGSGNAYFFAPGASINTETFNGVTFYAVWAKVE